MIRRTLNAFVILVLTSFLSLDVRGADKSDEFDVEYRKLYNAGRYVEAEPIGQQILAEYEKEFGDDALGFAVHLNNQALIYRWIGRHGDAEKLYKRSISIHERSFGIRQALDLGPDPALAGTLDALAGLYSDWGRTAAADLLYRLSLALRISIFGSNDPTVATSLNNLATLYAKSRPKEAEVLYERSLAIREKALGADHRAVAKSLNNLAALYVTQGRVAAAEPLYKRVLVVFEKSLGPSDVNIAWAQIGLARVYRAQGRLEGVEDLYKRGVEILEKALGHDHPDVGLAVEYVGKLYSEWGRYADAERQFVRSLAIRERSLGSRHPDVARLLDELQKLLHMQGRSSEERDIANRVRVVSEKAPVDDLYEQEVLAFPGYIDVLIETARKLFNETKVSDANDVANLASLLMELPMRSNALLLAEQLYRLAALLKTHARYPDAERLCKRSLFIRERISGLEHREVAESLATLGAIYYEQRRYHDAEPLFKRSLSIIEKSFGSDHLKVAQALYNLAHVYLAKGPVSDAEPLLLRSIEIFKKTPGSDNSLVAAHQDVGRLYEATGRDAEAEAAFERSLAIVDSLHTHDHPLVAMALESLALFYLERGAMDVAEPLLDRVLTIREKTLVPDHPLVGSSNANLATIFIGKSDWVTAFDYQRRATDVDRRRIERGSDKTVDEPGHFRSLVRVGYRITTERIVGDHDVTHGMFEMAQWALASEAGEALTQMAARSATGRPELAALARERQDLVSERHVKDQQLIGVKGQEPEKRNAVAEKNLADQLAAIDTRLADIDGRLEKDFPDHVALVRPKASTVAAVQAALHGDEALLLTLDTAEVGPLPEESFIWVITKSDVRWLRSELGTNALRGHVAALRCGLDLAAWSADSEIKCTELLGLPSSETPKEGEALPFDLDRAYVLYQSLLGGATDLIQGKRLLLVPSGPLTTLPFSALVTKRPTSRSVADAHWLVEDHAIRVLPSVSSLIALRRNGQQSGATKPLIAFANPLLDGDPSDLARADVIARRANLARRRVDCGKNAFENIAALLGLRGVEPFPAAAGHVDVAVLRAQVPLPESADEACEVAHDLNADQNEVRLGARATEAEVKALSESGALASFRVLHFATHAAVSGQISGFSEPGLILTPPEAGTERDDGYLSASEVAGLKLDADWVILSACNTGAGKSQSAEALSGLARAFFYAGARALLVSNWEVASSAAVRLTTGAVKALATDTSIGRSEALRRSMQALIKNGTGSQKHPSYWAPFVLVGEDGAASGLK